MEITQQELELRAYLALQGAAGAAGKVGDWRNDVAAAIRSSAPLSPEFREILAQMISGGRFGFRLELAASNGKKKRQQDLFGGVLARREWMEIGQWIADRIASGSNRTDAVRAASTEEFHSSFEKCDAAFVYFTRANRWLAALGNGQQLMDEDVAIAMFHVNDASGNPMDSHHHIAPEME